MATMGERRRLIVVGNGMAGARLVDEVARRAPGRYDITVFGAEHGAAYNRILLPSVLAGDKAETEIALEPSSATIHDAEPISAIDTAKRCVRTEAGRSFEYDALVLATGSTPIMLNVPGAGLSGVHSFRNLGDVQRLIMAAEGGGRAVVIGGGLLGLEAAEGLRRRGMSVTVVHLMPSLMERQLDAPAGALLRTDLARRGIGFDLAAETAEITGDASVTGVRLADGRVLPATLVVMAIGIRPSTALARHAGLTCNRGVAVDDALRTSDPAVYAVGECVEHRGRSYGLVAPLYEQVEICARQLAGETGAAYEGSMPATSLKVTGIDLYSAGELGVDSGEDIVFSDPARGVYRRLMLRKGRLSGAVLYGDATDGPWYFDLMRDRRLVADLRPDLVFGKAFAA